MDLGFVQAGSIEGIVKKIRVFADALEAAEKKLPPDADLIALADIAVRLYRPLKRKSKNKSLVEKTVEKIDKETK